ncbi:MAG: CDP-alcohol phosphatidyltransferase family protein [Parachlamydia sp.]|nr:CDP-alcohol phosphatidyltransferase family protein [Parachlamydia sp.]
MNFSNVLTLLRGPLVLLFLFESVHVRMLAVLLAMLTDCLDGYLARLYKMTSQLGAFLDPLMDKIFVIGAASILLHEGRLETWQLLSFLSRDFAVLLFGLTLFFQGQWSRLRFHSIWAGKIATALQFVVLLALLFNFSIPSSIFLIFISLGIISLFELFFWKYKTQIN